jgi:hypothetical protein
LKNLPKHNWSEKRLLRKMGKRWLKASKGKKYMDTNSIPMEYCFE